MGTHKKWSADEKMSVVIDGLKGLGLKEVCNKYGISDNQYYRWRDEAYKSMKGAFSDKRTKEVKSVSFEAERDRLLRVIGEQKVIIDLQKKIANDFS